MSKVPQQGILLSYIEPTKAKQMTWLADHLLDEIDHWPPSAQRKHDKNEAVILYLYVRKVYPFFPRQAKNRSRNCRHT